MWALAGLAPLPAFARDWSGLVKRNPFGDPPPSEKPAEPAPSLELRGVVKERGGYLLSLYDADSKKSWWMEVGRSEDDWLARDYDPKQEVAMLEKRGKSLALNLKSSLSRGATVIARSSQEPRGAIGHSAPGPSQVAMNPLPAGEVRRLVEIGEQIRRRREQRQRQSG